MWSASSFDAFSPTACGLLSDLGVSFEAVPAVIYDSAKRALTTEYAYLHVVDCLKAVDWEHSDIDVGESSDGEAYVRQVRHLVLTPEVIRANLPVFRLDEKRTLVLVNDEFRSEWQRRGLTGASFRPIDHYPKQ